MNKGVILAIDDSAESLKLLAQILGREDYTFRAADSGELGLASAISNPPDLILLDIRMASSPSRESMARLTGTSFAPFDRPNAAMDGFAVCHQLQTRPETRDIPVIFLSGTTDNDERVEALRMGAVDFVSKPFRADELLARIQTHLELGRTRRGLKKTVGDGAMKLQLATESIDVPLNEAVAARDWPMVIRLFEPTALLQFGQQASVRDWLMRLPAEAIDAEPGLAFWRAYTLVGLGRLVAAERCATAADKQVTLSGDNLQLARLRSIRSRIAGWNGNTAEALEMAQQGLALAKGGTPFQTAMGHHWLGLAYTLVGNPRAAADQFLAVCSECEQLEGPRKWLASVGFCWYGRALFLQGRINDAMAVCRQAVTIEREYGGPAVNVSHGLDAEIFLTRRQSNAARQALEKAVDMDGLFEQWFSIPITWLAVARFHYAHGSALAGDDTVDNLVEWARRNDCPGIKDSAEAIRVNHWLVTGQIERSWLWAIERNIDLDAPITYPREPSILAAARVSLHRARSSGNIALCRKAVDALSRLRIAAEADFRMGDALTAGISEALGLQALGDVDAALARLEPLIARGAAESFYSVFHDEGEPILSLLQLAYERGILPESTRELIAVFGYEDPLASILKSGEPTDARSSQLMNPLTDREQELLELIAAGLTNADLADKLFITHNTVKTHIKHLFQKLGVSTRTEAVARARSAGLLG